MEFFSSGFMLGKRISCWKKISALNYGFWFTITIFITKGNKSQVFVGLLTKHFYKQFLQKYFKVFFIKGNKSRIMSTRAILNKNSLT